MIRSGDLNSGKNEPEDTPSSKAICQYYPDRKLYMPQIPITKTFPDVHATSKTFAVENVSVSDKKVGVQISITPKAGKEHASHEIWTPQRVADVLGVELVLLRDDQFCEAYDKLKKDHDTLSRRQLFLALGGGVAGAMLGGIAGGVVSQQMNSGYEDGRWDSDFEHWKEDITAKGIERCDITPEAKKLLQQMGVRFSENTMILPDGDTMYFQKDSDHEVQSSLLIIDAHKGEVMIRFQQGDADLKELSNNYRFLNEDGSRNTNLTDTFSHWQDYAMQQGAEVHILDASFRNEWGRRGLTMTHDGACMVGTTVAIPLTESGSVDWQTTQIRCDYNDRTGEMSMQFYEFNENASIKNRSRTLFIRPDGSVHKRNW